MPSRGVEFTQEIRDAIEACDRLIEVIGPASVKSVMCRDEWQHALATCVVVTPVLRLGDYSLLPDELSELQCLDFRTQLSARHLLQGLLRVLSFGLWKGFKGDRVSLSYRQALNRLFEVLEEPASVGGLHGVPSLPAHFLPRTEELESLREALLAGVFQRLVITSAKQSAALVGMGGVGKTVLAMALARDCQVRRAFADGVIWLAAGLQPNLLGMLKRAALALGDDLTHYVEIDAAQPQLQNMLAERACLLVLDNVWEVSHAQPFVNAIGPRCRLLMTTRIGGLVATMGAQQCRVDVLGEEGALKLLAQASGKPLDSLRAEASEVARACGYLPLALDQCGISVRKGNSWADILSALRHADLTPIAGKLKDYEYLDAFRAFQASLDLLSRTQPSVAPRYLELAAFPPDQPIPETAAVTLWTHTGRLTESEGRLVFTTICGYGMSQRVEGESPKRTMLLHNLQADYVRLLSDDVRAAQEKLLEAYRKKCSAGWHTSPNDGYLYQNLAWHLKEADRQEELRKLLLDFNWLQAKLRATDVTALTADYDYVGVAADSYAQADRPLPGVPIGIPPWRYVAAGFSPAEVAASSVRDTDVKSAQPPSPDPGVPDPVSLLQGALRLSAHVLARDKSQLTNQLVGRLGAYPAREIQAVLDEGQRSPIGPCLKLRTPSLMPPGGPLVRTLEGHSNRVTAVAVTPEGGQAIWASFDGTLKVWDLKTGKEARTLEGDSDWVTAVAVTPEGGQAISAFDDNTLKVWDLKTGKAVRTLEGHSGPVTAVAVTPEGGQAISASRDHTLKVWDLKTGKEVRTLEGHSNRVTAVAVTTEGGQAISASDDKTLKVWDLKTGKEVRTLEGHSDRVTAVAVTPEGGQAISAPSDRT